MRKRAFRVTWGQPFSRRVMPSLRSTSFASFASTSRWILGAAVPAKRSCAIHVLSYTSLAREMVRFVHTDATRLLKERLLPNASLWDQTSKLSTSSITPGLNASNAKVISKVSLGTAFTRHNVSSLVNGEEGRLCSHTLQRRIKCLSTNSKRRERSSCQDSQRSLSG